MPRSSKEDVCGVSRPLRALRSGAIPCWGGVVKWASSWVSYATADPSAALRDDNKGDCADSDEAFRLTVLPGLATVPSTGTEACGPRPAKRSSWWPERKRIWIQRKM